VQLNNNGDTEIAETEKYGLNYRGGLFSVLFKYSRDYLGL